VKGCVFIRADREWDGLVKWDSTRWLTGKRIGAVKEEGSW